MTDQQRPPETEVRLVVTVDLTGTYHSANDVSEALRTQTMRSVDCHTAIVHLGDDALRHSLFLPRAIAGVFFLAAQRIEIHVPAGSPLAPWIAEQTGRELRQMRVDHDAMLASLPSSTG